MFYFPVSFSPGKDVRKTESFEVFVGKFRIDFVFNNADLVK